MGKPGIDQIIRARRKTIALIITREGKLIVRAPQYATRHQIETMVAQKAEWIEQKQKAARERLAQLQIHQFSHGETFLYLGQNYPMQWTGRMRPLLSLEEGRFLVSLSAQKRAREVFEAWYRTQARQVLAERIAYYEAITGLQHQSLRITAARTRWGSCSFNGTLSFPWRLIMAPLSVVDYVVVHELAHLQEHNHSDRFWARVEAIQPNYREYIRWLKTNGHRLNLA